MHQASTWRELLGKSIEDPYERQRITTELGVTPITLTRWVKRESNPRPHYLQRLLTALPQQKVELVELIEEEFPDFSSCADEEHSEGILTAIPTEFYTRVLHTHTMVPDVLRFTSLCDLISRQVLDHLDPLRIGISAIVTSCMPLSHGDRVHCIRERIGRGTPPWGNHLEQQAVLLGSESLAGYAVSSGHVVMNASLSDEPGQYAGYRSDWEESAAAAPIMRGGRVAGSLLVSSVQPHFFLSEHLTCIQNYAELLGLAFNEDDYYDLALIDLWPLPLAHVQQPYLAGFRKRVVAIMTHAAREQHAITLAEAELIVWQQFEEELFRSLQTSVS